MFTDLDFAGWAALLTTATVILATVIAIVVGLVRKRRNATVYDFPANRGMGQHAPSEPQPGERRKVE